MGRWWWLLGVAVAGYGTAALWVALVACEAPEEDGCASAGSSVLYVLMVGTPIVLLLGVVVALWRRGRSH